VSASRRPAFDIITHGPDQTRAIAAQVGKLLPRGSVVLLSGGLGAGKTTFVQGLARPMRTGDQIQSPTFTIVAEHQGTDPEGHALRLYHMDLYRLGGAEDLETIGLDDYLSDPDGITVIEWPDRAVDWMPDAYLLVELEAVADSKRSLKLTPVGKEYREVIERFRREVVGGRA
jgi:tRNA threonylcarbamoyladenosine biosynthesis protein TsaE